MAGLFLTFLIEYIAHRWVDKKRHIFERSRAIEATRSAQKDAGTSDAPLSEVSSAEQHYPVNAISLNTSIMEAGIIFHSICELGRRYVIEK